MVGMYVDLQLTAAAFEMPLTVSDLTYWDEAALSDPPLPSFSVPMLLRCP